jgi:hypothetical protein
VVRRFYIPQRLPKIRDACQPFNLMEQNTRKGQAALDLIKPAASFALFLVFPLGLVFFRPWWHHSQLSLD